MSSLSLLPITPPDSEPELHTWNRARGYKTFFMLTSAEHKIWNAHTYKISRNSAFLGSDKPKMLFFPLINVKMPTIVGILTFMSRKNFMLNCVEHEKRFIISGPDFSGHTQNIKQKWVAGKKPEFWCFLSFHVQLQCTYKCTHIVCELKKPPSFAKYWLLYL